MSKLRFLLDVKFLMMLTSASLLFSMTLEFLGIGQDLFQRSGAVVGAIGAIMVIRNITSVGSESAAKNLCEIDGGSADNSGSYAATFKEAKQNVVAIQLGTTLIVIGAVVSGYGDLFIKMF